MSAIDVTAWYTFIYMCVNYLSLTKTFQKFVYLLIDVYTLDLFMMLRSVVLLRKIKKTQLNCICTSGTMLLFIWL